MTISRRYEGAPTPVARKPAVKKPVKKLARRPSIPGTARRYAAATLPLAKRPVPKPSPAAANDVRHAPAARPMRPSPVAANDMRKIPTARPGARRGAEGAAANDMRKAFVPPRSAWQTQAMFNPNVRLDASQVQDLRGAHTRVSGRVRARHVYNRDFRGRVEGVIPNRPTTPARRVGKSQAI